MKHYELENTNCFNKSHFGPMSHSVTQPGGMTLTPISTKMFLTNLLAVLYGVLRVKGPKIIKGAISGLKANCRKYFKKKSLKIT